MEIEILRKFPGNKGDIQALACDWTNQILEGNMDPIKVAVQIKKVQAVLDQVSTGIKEYVLSEVEKYGKGTEIEGVRLEVSDLGVRYDYSVCGDPSWDELNRQITALTEQRKSREKFLSAIPDEGTVDISTGCAIHRPVRQGTRGLKMTIK